MYLCKRDLSQECKGGYKDCTDCVLDKIRAEIEQLPITDTAIRLVTEIIDKHKAESEDDDES